MTRPLARAAGAALIVTSLLCAGPALAWTRPGHMLTAAIAFDDLMARNPAAAAVIADIISRHPDRAPFQVAVERTAGPDATLRLMMECARWPDDARGTMFDHPTWHYGDTPSGDAPAPLQTSGQAIDALELNFHEAADPQAPVADRALALCWVMHLAGDIHQPLHTSTIYSPRFPKGDAGGTLQFVIDPEVNKAVSLHWYWDDRVNKSADPHAIEMLAAKLEKKFTRDSLNEMTAASAQDFAQWAAESHALAIARAYPPDLVTGSSEADAKPLPPGYSQMVEDVASRRIALAGYRLATLLEAIAAAPPPKDVR